MDDNTDKFLLIPARSGGGAIVRRSQIAGSRANGDDGAIVYLVCGPSVYTSATIPEMADILSAEVARVR